MLRDGVYAEIEKNSYPVLPIFKLMQKKGDIDEHVMYNTYNMGIGMVLAVRPEDVDATMKAIRDAGEYSYQIGHIRAGEKGVKLI